MDKQAQWDIETLQGTIGVIPYETMEREALKRAIKALEKQVPMKPAFAGGKYNCQCGWDVYRDKQPYYKSTNTGAQRLRLCLWRGNKK